MTFLLQKANTIGISVYHDSGGLLKRRSADEVHFPAEFLQVIKCIQLMYIEILLKVRWDSRFACASFKMVFHDPPPLAERIHFFTLDVDELLTKICPLQRERGMN